jgi:hypothetical protein
MASSTRSKPDDAPGSRLASALPWVVLAAGLAFAFSVRVRLLDLPLERDEGEYAYAGQLILEGTPPYAEVSNMKLPGTYYAYAAFEAVFGETQRGIHLGLALWTTASAIVLFLIGRRLFGALAGAAAAAVFALLGISEGVLGLAAHATHFIVLPMLAGCLLLLEPEGGRERTRALGAGLLFGISFLMKQHAAPLLVFGALFLGWRGGRGDLRRVATRVALYSFGAILPYALFCLYAWGGGFFDSFWFWTVTYARQYVSGMSFHREDPFGLLGEAMHWNETLWILAGAGAVFLGFRRVATEARVFCGGFTLCSLLAVCPGLYLRNQYFIVLLPALALLGAAGLAEAPHERRAGRVPIRRASWAALLVAATAVTVIRQRPVFFTAGIADVSKFVYFSNPFVESIEIARYVRERSAPGDRIAVMGSEPQIYFYARRRSAARYPYVYALMESHPYAHRLQEETIHEIEAARPKWIIVVRIGNSWLIRPSSDRTIINWLGSYLVANYDVDGVVEVTKDAPATYRWGKDSFTGTPASPKYVMVWRRRTS